MKRFGIGSTALTLLLFGATYSFAQEKPAQHEEQGGASHQAQPAQHEQKAAPAQHEEKAPAAQHTEKAPVAQRTEKSQPAQTAKRAEPAKTVKPTARVTRTEEAKPATQPSRSAARTSPNTRTTNSPRTSASARNSTNTRTQQAHNFGGHGGGHIDDVHFRASFGNEHHFHMNRPTMYEGYSRFNYGGYYFGFYDPWPSGWGYSDDVYVDYIDGQYYLIDPEHPGPRLMINVVL